MAREPVAGGAGMGGEGHVELLRQSGYKMTPVN
jgi:hypothetical protein